jgi:hypothetical protein
MATKRSAPDPIFRGLPWCDLCGGPLRPGEIGGLCQACRKPTRRKRPRTIREQGASGADRVSRASQGG